MPIHATVVVFNISVLLSVSLILCTLVPALLSKSIARSPSWYNLMIAWLVYSLSYGLLVGNQETPNEPPLALCVTQTLLIYAAPVLTVSAMLNLYIELYFILLGLKSGNFGTPNRGRSFWLIVTPWLFFIAIIIEVLLIMFPGGRLYLVRRAPATNFYCHLEDLLPRRITATIVVAAIGIILPLQAWLAFTLYRSSDALKRLTEDDHQLLITIYVRLTLATLCAILGFGFSLSSLVAFHTDSDETTLAYPIFGFATTIVFTTQKDILRAWLFWRPSRPCSSILFRVSGSHETGREAGLRNTNGSSSPGKGGRDAGTYHEAIPGNHRPLAT